MPFCNLSLECQPLRENGLNTRSLAGRGGAGSQEQEGKEDGEKGDAKLCNFVCGGVRKSTFG